MTLHGSQRRDLVESMEQAADTTEWLDAATSELQVRYANRELSWLDFNERVLELAEDPSVPLLERVKFLAIYTTGLDEFFMIRVAGLHDQVDAGVDARSKDGLGPSRTIDEIARRVRDLERRHSHAWAYDIL